MDFPVIGARKRSE